MDPRFLYKGYVPPLFGMGLEKAVVFGTFHNVKVALPETMTDNTRIALAGAASGFAASFIVSPYERLKIQLQTGQQLSVEHIRPSKLFVGLSATFTRETPGFAIYFTNYEYWKRRWWTQNDLDIDPISSFFLGGSSGVAAWIFIYPQDQIKTIMQSASVGGAKSSFVGTAKQIYARRGLTGFYYGFHLALMRAVPLHAGTFMTMEYIQQHWLGVKACNE